MKKLLIIVIILVSMLILASCEDNDRPPIFEIVDMLLNNRQDGTIYTFEAEINIVINKDYLLEIGILNDTDSAEFDAVPDEISFRFVGELQHISGNEICAANINVYVNGESESQLTVKIANNALYIADAPFTRIISDLLTVTGFAEQSVARAFNEAFHGRVLRVDLTDFDLSWFFVYAEQILRTFDVDITFGITSKTPPSAIAAPNFSFDILVDFDAAFKQAQRAFRRLPGFRYAELYVILSPRDNTVNVLAIRENGEREVLAPRIANINLAAIIAELGDDYSETTIMDAKIFPMRYLLELMGEYVGWNYDTRRPFVVRDEILYFDAVIENSRSYINIMQIMAIMRFNVSIVHVGEYIELRIIR